MSVGFEGVDGAAERSWVHFAIRTPSDRADRQPKKPRTRSICAAFSEAIFGERMEKVCRHGRTPFSHHHEAIALTTMSAQFGSRLESAGHFRAGPLGFAPRSSPIVRAGVSSTRVEPPLGLILNPVAMNLQVADPDRTTFWRFASGTARGIVPANPQSAYRGIPFPIRLPTTGSTGLEGVVC